MKSKKIIPLILILLTSIVIVPVLASPVPYRNPWKRRGIAVSYVLANYPKVKAPLGSWVSDWSNSPISVTYTSGNWIVTIGLWGNQPAIVDYDDGQGTILHWEGNIYRYDDTITTNTVTYITPPPAIEVARVKGIMYYDYYLGVHAMTPDEDVNTLIMSFRHLGVEKIYFHLINVGYVLEFDLDVSDKGWVALYLSPKRFEGPYQLTIIGSIGTDTIEIPYRIS